MTLAGTLLLVAFVKVFALCAATLGVVAAGALIVYEVAAAWERAADGSDRDRMC